MAVNVCTVLLGSVILAAAAAAAAAASAYEIPLALDTDGSQYYTEDDSFADDVSERSEIYGDRNPIPSSVFTDKRSGAAKDFLCGRWDDWCQQGSTRPGLSCCTGYHCKCHLLWNSNCRCRSKLFGGK